MSNVYLVPEGTSPSKLERIVCKDEDKELQQLLERNLDLLPGDQIDPENRLRWLLIKREMPVVNPASGNVCWSIDFFLTDQYGVPTLVECKRCNNPQARREVIGQMLEYAANGRHYWSASDMRSHAQTSNGGEVQLSERLASLGQPQDAEAFFATVEQNLRRSKMRLIFFLEDSPLELRSIVEFLNAQLKDTEVLIVEARQYRHGTARVVVPWLFGFTEEARVAKRESKAETVRASIAKGEAAFWQAIGQGFPDKADVARFHDLVEGSRMFEGCKVTWIVSCIFIFPNALKNRGLFGIKRNGDLELYLSYWMAAKYPDVGQRQTAIREMFIQNVTKLFGLSLSPNAAFPTIPSNKWLPLAVQFAEIIEQVAIAAQTDQIEAEDMAVGALV